MRELLPALHQLREILLVIPCKWTLARKEKVHFFQCPVRRLRIESPHHGNAKDIDGAEDIQSLLGDAGEHDGVEQSEPAVANRPPEDAPCVSFRSDFEREDLGLSGSNVSQDAQVSSELKSLPGTPRVSLTT